MEYFLNDKKIIITIEINRRHKSVKIKVSPPYYVTFISPISLSNDYVIAAIERHKRFIISRLDTPLQQDNDYSIHLFGKKYEILALESKFANYKIIDDTIQIYSPMLDDMTISHIVMLLYKYELQKFVEKKIDLIKKEMGIDFNINIRYKRVKTYFGECIPKRKTVIFSTNLCKYSEKYILSVIYHELAHFYYMDHQERFYKLLESKFPNYKETQKELRQIRYNDRF